MGAGRNEQHSIGDRGSRVHGTAHVHLVERVVLFRGEFEHGQVPVFIADNDASVDDRGRAPHRGQQVVRPVDLTGLGVQAMHQSTEVGDHEQAILNGGRAHAAMKLLFEIELPVAVLVGLIVAPHDRRIRIGDRNFTFGRNHRLFAPHGDDL